MVLIFVFNFRVTRKKKKDVLFFGLFFFFFLRKKSGIDWNPVFAGFHVLFGLGDRTSAH